MPDPIDAREFETLVLRRVAAKGQGRVADALQYDDSKISRFLSNHEGLKLKAIGQLLNALGLSVIESDGEIVTLPRSEYDALRVLTKKAVTDL